ncbi:MAG: aminodeoxychorismate synthase component I [Candidatus Eiseniibacteriota bacterium]
MATSAAVALERGAPVDAVLRARALPEGWTPLRVLTAVERRPHTLFLESQGPLGAESEWTILAFDPAWRLELRDGALWRIEGATSARLAGHPLDALAASWPGRQRYERTPSVPFAGGLAGYLAYDFKDWIERFPAKARRELDLPDLSLGYYDVAWAWNRATGEAWAVTLGDAARLDAQWASLEKALGESQTHVASHNAAPPPRAVSNFTRDDYLRVVERALEHIAAGDIYQVNLAQRFLVDPAPPLPEFYRSLRQASPAPFLALVTLPEGGIASSSPERFFRVSGDRIETWPIKGTRPRGRNAAEDLALASALRQSEKDRAENVMIVDLERNDLGRVAEIGTVTVSELCGVTSHANVHHLVSRVEGRLRPDAGPVDVIRALFPGGSITGAPKIRAVQVIDDLEPIRRGVYTGAIGYWDRSGDCDWNIAIRTVVLTGGRASFHAGGGIVADSTPEAEYEETLVKASGMMRALGVAPLI